MAKHTGEGDAIYVHDGSDILLRFVGGDIAMRFLHGDRIDQVLALVGQDSGFYYHADHLGSIRALTSKTAIVATRYTYDSFGRSETSGTAATQPLVFTGREWDSENATYYYRERHYFPISGRFASEDPFDLATLPSGNSYAYGLQSPLMYVDPSGLVDIRINGEIWRSPIGGDLFHPLTGYKNPGAHFTNAVTGEKYFPDIERVYDPRNKTVERASPHFQRTFNEALSRLKPPVQESIRRRMNQARGFGPRLSIPIKSVLPIGIAVQVLLEALHAAGLFEPTIPCPDEFLECVRAGNCA